MIDARIEIADPKMQHIIIIADCITLSPPCTNGSSPSLYLILRSFLLDIISDPPYLKTVPVKESSLKVFIVNLI